MAEQQLPPALRSRLHVLETQYTDTATQTPPLTLCGSTYTMAQEATTRDDHHFAIGRWDGSMEIFAFTAGAGQAPILNCAVKRTAAIPGRWRIPVSDRGPAPKPKCPDCT